MYITLKSLMISLIFFGIVFAAGDDKDKFGNDITLTDKTKISAILEDPEIFLDKIVLVEGEILDVCSMAGCWMELASDIAGNKIKIKVKDGEIVFPIEAIGRVALVEGKVYKIELTKEDAVKYYEHIAEERGEEFNPDSLTGPATIYQIKGIGAEIDKE